MPVKQRNYGHFCQLARAAACPYRRWSRYHGEVVVLHIMWCAEHIVHPLLTATDAGVPAKEMAATSVRF